MSTQTGVRKTPIHDQHEALGARMVPFAGWRMPVQYRGIIEEHMAVREQAGLFDVSHMGEARVYGPEATAMLQWCTTNDVARLKIHRAHYTALTTEQGTFVDDLLIYRRGEDDYLLVLNAANTAKDLAALRAQQDRFDAVLEDVSGRWCQLAVQGPRAEEILVPLFGDGICELKYYGFLEQGTEEAPRIISRTGYTGEDGFEIYAPWSEGADLWQRIQDAGSGHGLQPVGLAARDTLRLEAGMALYGNDIDDSTTVIEADLGWIVKLKRKGEFLGREILARQKLHGAPRKLVGFELEGRRIARHGYPVLIEGREVGRVTSGTFAPFLKKSIGMVYLPTDRSDVVQTFEIDIRGRQVTATVVATPFYSRPS